MVMPERSFSNEKYRWGFNGKETDNEVNGAGNSLDFGARIYDSRLGRWSSIDPLQAKYPFLSPYIFAAENPILFIDKEGKENVVYIVNVPNAKGEKVMTDIALQAYIDKANEFMKSDKNGVGAKTTFVLYDPSTMKEMKRENMDKTDGVILVGSVLDVKKYDETHKLSEKAGTDAKNDIKGWTGGSSNPERTMPDINGVGMVDAEALKSATSDFMGLTFLHSAGHLSQQWPGEHSNENINGTIKPNIMMDAGFLAIYYNQKTNGVDNKLSDIPKAKTGANLAYKTKLEGRFGRKEHVVGMKRQK